MTDDDQPKLFDDPDDEEPDETPKDPDRDYAAPLTGKYHGHDATPTERASGEAVEIRAQGPLKPGKVGHLILREFQTGERMTSYDAGFRAFGYHHKGRRESTRLLVDGFLVKDGTLPNQAPGGRKAVDAYRITDAGRAELARLDGAA